jgi:transcriptional regulator with XRE-family HTH domain
MARQHSVEEKAQAVARVMAGESRRQVANDTGVGASTVKRWVAAANTPVTEVDVLLAEDAGDIAERIRQRQAQVRELLLDRLFALAPDTRSLKECAIAYGIVTDKALLAAGKPTSIHHEALMVPDDASEEELAAMADELQRRRLESPVEDCG